MECNLRRFSQSIVKNQFFKKVSIELGDNFESITRLKGGINSLVYRCRGVHQDYVVKIYPQEGEECKIRATREISFLTHANNAAQDFVPSLIYSNRNEGYLVMEYIEESDIRGNDCLPSQSEVESALEFVNAINRDDATRIAYKIRAAEGYQCLHEHLDNCRYRISRLTRKDLSESQRKYSDSLRRELNARLEHLGSRIYSAINTGLLVDCTKDEWSIISPGDFGFHNAIRTSDRIVFIDFEFSGLDDSMKTCLDFQLNPRFDMLFESSPLLKGMSHLVDDIFWRRYKALHDLLRIKWAAIMLGVLDEERWAKMTRVTSTDEQDELVDARLNSCSKYLSRSKQLF